MILTTEKEKKLERLIKEFNKEAREDNLPDLDIFYYEDEDEE